MDINYHPQRTRPRVDRACDGCRVKKCKCDGEQPCSKCKEGDLICHYSDRKRYHSRKVPEGYVELVEEQYERLAAGLVEMYRRMVSAGAWDGPILQETGTLNKPLTHDILKAMDILSTPLPSDKFRLCERCGLDLDSRKGSVDSKMGSQTSSPVNPPSTESQPMQSANFDLDLGISPLDTSFANTMDGSNDFNAAIPWWPSDDIASPANTTWTGRTDSFSANLEDLHLWFPEDNLQLSETFRAMPLDSTTLMETNNTSAFHGESPLGTGQRPHSHHSVDLTRASSGTLGLNDPASTWITGSTCACGRSYAPNELTATDVGRRPFMP